MKHGTLIRKFPALWTSWILLLTVNLSVVPAPPLPFSAAPDFLGRVSVAAGERIGLLGVLAIALVLVVGTASLAHGKGSICRTDDESCKEKFVTSYRESLRSLSS